MSAGRWRERLRFGGASGGGPAGTLVVAVATLLVACGGPKAERPNGDPGRRALEELRVTVENDLTPRTPVQVRLEALDGGGRFLGSVSPGRTRTFEFEDTGYAGAYRLVGETGGGRRLQSRSFQLVPAAWVQWTLTPNSISMGYGYRTGDTVRVKHTGRER